MIRNSEDCRSNCPINFVLETFGDKWTLLIVRDLMFKGKSSYSEFLQSGEKISTNILANRLKKLEDNGLVEKSVAADNRSKLIYSLTSKGKDLLPIMLEITVWSAKHDTATNTPDSFLSEFTSSKPEMVTKILSNLR
ncbi:MAG: DNA-binding HxlR family transcriptional regulator [Paraglaciecola sp.]|jgi:DNA-binding HxlR family transcriptional regulator